MHPSVARHAARVHKPLIRFIGKRTFPSTPDAPHAHPAAPLEFKQRFSEFTSKREGTSASPSSSIPTPAAKAGSNTVTYEDFWQAPSRLWTRQLGDKEIAAIMACPQSFPFPPVDSPHVPALERRRIGVLRSMMQTSEPYSPTIS